MKKFILLATVLIWTALGAFAWYYVNRPTGNIASTRADFTVTSSAFYNQFDENEETANQQYLGKVIEVSGKVQEVSLDENGDLSLTLDGNEMFGVICRMNGDGRDIAKKINKGDGIKVKGVCSGKLMDVVLVNCSLLNS